MCLCLPVGAAFDESSRPIIVGIVMDDTTPAEREPLRTYLTQAMGRPVTIASPDTYSETVANLGSGAYDFACLGALMYIRAHAKYGVVPLVQRLTDLRYHTAFITGADSSIHSLGDLRGRQFAFGDLDSTSAHMMAEYELKKAKIDPQNELRLRYSGSHPATAAMVADGVVDAGAIDATVLRFLVNRGKVDAKKIRVFYTSAPYIDYVFVARKDVAEVERQRFAQALLALKQGKDDSVLSILRAAHFVVADDQEYAEARKIAHDLKMY